MGLFKWVGNLFFNKNEDVLDGSVDDLRNSYKSALWKSSDYLTSDNDFSLSGTGIDDDFSSTLGANDLFEDEVHCPRVNPANGLPMLGCSVDIDGNPYGTDFSHDDMIDNNGIGLLGDSISSCSGINLSSGLSMVDELGENQYGINFSDDSFSSFDDSFGSSGFGDDW